MIGMPPSNGKGGFDMLILRSFVGFSLIEVMISLVILSFLMMGIYTIVDNSQRTKEFITAEDNSVLQVQLALNRLDSDFSQMYSPLYFSAKKEAKKSSNEYQPSEQFPNITEEGHPVPLLDQSDDSTLTFMTSSNRRKMQDIKQSRWTWVQYTLEDFDSSQAWVRKSVAGNPFAEQIYWDKIRPQVLVRKVASVNFWFRDVEKKEWVEDLQNISGKLYAIKVELNWYDVNDIEQTNTRVFRVLWPHPNFFFDLLQVGFVTK